MNLNSILAELNTGTFDRNKGLWRWVAKTNSYFVRVSVSHRGSAKNRFALCAQ